MSHAPTMMSARPLAASVRMTAATVLALLLVGLLSPAGALPPGGASSDTAGTSGSVSPSKLRAGDVIRFSVSGFPAGQTINVKIDDGEFCSDKSVHGACVVHQQRIDASGRVSGSFALPADIGEGEHWLRFLASEELLDAEGRYVGVKPYSMRGDATFTVAAAGVARDEKSPSSADSPDASVRPGDRTDAADRSAVGLSTDAGADAGDIATLRVPAPPASAGGVTAGDSEQMEVDASSAQTDLDPVVRNAGEPFPYVGAGALLVAVVGAALLALRGRTARTRSRA